MFFLVKPHDIFIAHQKKSFYSALQEDKKAAQILLHLHKPLYMVKSFFPFELFPDVLVVNAVEVIFIDNMFFWTDYRTSMLIEEIGDIFLVESPFFASITIYPTMTIKNPPIKIGHVTRSKAHKAYYIIQGLITLKKEKVDVEPILSQQNGLEEIMEIGKTEVITS